MPRLYSTAPTSLLRRRRSFSSSTSTSPPSRRAPHVALAAATERVRSGTLSHEDTHDLFDELLHQDTPVPARALNGFLAALARAPASAACRDVLSLAVTLFNRMPRRNGSPVAPPTVHTYGILLDCSCRARQPDLALAFFGHFLKAGLKANTIIVNTLLKVLCHTKRTDEAVDVLLQRMPYLETKLLITEKKKEVKLAKVEARREDAMRKAELDARMLALKETKAMKELLAEEKEIMTMNTKDMDEDQLAWWKETKADIMTRKLQARQACAASDLGASMGSLIDGVSR